MSGYVAVFAALIALAVVAWLVRAMVRIGAVSRGSLIAQRPGRALLLVDLQTVFWEHGPYDEAAKTEAAKVILDEAACAKANGVPIIAVRQEWSDPSTKLIARVTMKGQAVEGTRGTEIADSFDQQPDYVLVKRVQDAFETGELDRLLEDLNVGGIRVVGLDMNYCVAKTSLAARQRGYEVEVVSAAVLASDIAKVARTRATLTEKGIQVL